MRFCITALLLATPVFALFARFADAQTPPPDYAPDEALLKGQNLPTKGPALLELLRKRIPSPEVIAEFKKQVARTQSKVYPVRKEASDTLIKMGDVVRPLLQNYLKETNTDLETVRRLGQVLEHFPADKDFATISAAARLIRRDKPADSTKVLFDFIPYVTDEHVRQEVQRTINAVGDKDQLLVLLKDENASRRAAAVEALVQAHGDKVKDAITPLMKDAHPLVRYQLGMALVEQRDRAGLPLLIRSIEGPAERVEFVLDMLYRAAGETAPPEYYSPAQSAKFVAKWEQWLETHGAKIDLPKQMTRTELGFTVIATGSVGVKGKSKIFELGPDKSVRWEFEGPRNPYDVQILGANRLLIAEYTERRVTERDFKGAILWQCNLATLPVACQRLPNGHTFIVTRQQLLIVDRDGKDVFTHALNQPGVVGTITTATRLRNGNFVVISSGGRCHLLDAKGQELKVMNLGGNVYPIGGSVDVLPNGNVLVPLYTNNRIAEFDWTGKVVWQANAPGLPLSATRLTNGNTLVSFMNNRVAELNPAGQEVWSYQTDGRALRVRRR